jgi:protein Mpv17
VDAYLAALAAAPLAMRCATSGFLWSLSDIIAQKSESESQVTQDLSLRRIARYAFFGIAVYTPLFVAYYTVQDAVVDHSVADSPVLAPLIKLGVDQLLWTPFFYLPIFFGGMALLEGLSLKQAKEEAWEKGWGLTPTLKANWKFWIPVNAVNYLVMPRELRIVWINICSLLWTIYLSQTRK